MKVKPAMLLLSLVLWGCIDDQQLTREADILSFSIDSDEFLGAAITNDAVQIDVSDLMDPSQITPSLTLSPGASVYPASGEGVNFLQQNPITYVVTAEDERYAKEYRVELVVRSGVFADFEYWETIEDKYQQLTDLSWDSPNQGVALAAGVAGVEIAQYPTDQTDVAAVGNYAAQLTTIAGVENPFTGKIPIFGGTIFKGSFSANPVNPLLSLRLGVPHPKRYGEPISFRGYYQYSPGPVYTDENENVVEDKVDQMALYALLYRVTKGAAADQEYLTGEDVFTSDRVVATAIWEADHPGLVEEAAENGYTHFVLPFDYEEAIDYEQYDYRLVMFGSSSREGSSYRGAIGSQLLIDNLEVICDTPSN